MKRFVVRHKNTQKVLASRVELADHFWSRLQGLMFQRNWEKRGGLLLDPCQSIHTFFMKISLDVIFLNSKNQVVKIFRNLTPWKMTKIYFSSRKVLELPAQSLESFVQVGDELEIICLS